MVVRPIDLAFMNDINKARSGMSFSPRATYGSTEPLANNQITNNPVRITINPSGVLPKPQLVQPDVVQQDTNAFSGLLGNNFTDPKTMGLLGASAELLKAGGYSVGKPAPTMGEALGNAMTTGMANYLAVQQAQNKANAPVSLPKGGMLVNPRTGQVVVDGRNKGGFEGTGITNQSFNTLLTLSDKIKNNTASNVEKQKYRLAYGYLSKPVNETINMADGTVKQIQRPAQDLAGFPNPFPNQQSSGSKVVGEKPSAQKLKILENRPKLTTMLSNLNQYINKLKSLEPTTQASGMIGFPSAEASGITALAETLRLDIKNLYELGALVGGDFQILDNLLTSPNSSAGIRMGASGLLQQIYRLENTLLDKLREGGFDEATGSESDPITITKPEEWNKARFGLYYKLPDNSIKLKIRKRQ